MAEESENVWGIIPTTSNITFNGRRITWAVLGLSAEELEGVPDNVKLSWLRELTGIDIVLEQVLE